VLWERSGLRGHLESPSHLSLGNGLSKKPRETDRTDQAAFSDAGLRGYRGGAINWLVHCPTGALAERRQVVGNPGTTLGYIGEDSDTMRNQAGTAAS
jgi:hypothetical protein